ncbi:hypothetical protein HRbin12_01735 [bacterium HR12]|nr:hypothetical protein HRbin12_01735 [bacterium HR12]
MLDEEVGPERRPLAPQDGEEAPPLGARRGDPHGVGDRGREVHVRGERRRAAPRHDPAGVPADHERDADRLLVGDLLAAPAVLAPEDPVVGGVDEERVLEAAGLAQGPDEVPDHPVHREERGVLVPPELVDVLRALATQRVQVPHPGRLVGDVLLVEGGRAPGRQVLEGALVPRRRDRRTVGRRWGEVEEQRPRGLAHERRRRPGEHGRRVVLRRLAVPAHGPVDRERVPVVLRVDEGHPPVPPGRHVPGEPGVLVPVEVLAEQPRRVPGVVEPGREGRVVPEPLEPTVGRDLAVDARGVRVAAGEDRGPARAADRVDDEGVGEARAAPDELALHGRHGPERVGALVVGDEEHDGGGRVGTRGLGPGGGCGIRDERGDDRRGGRERPPRAAHPPRTRASSSAMVATIAARAGSVARFSSSAGSRRRS